MLLEDGLSIYLTAMGELEPGSVFAGHRIDAVAGRGGMGVVYRATQLALDRTVALKVIAPGLLEDQTVRARFVRESKVAASIDHPNVIPIYYAGDEGGIAYIAMRYVAGDDVRSLVRREGRLQPERAARIVAQIGAALDEAHSAGLVHRDVKPANVLLTAEDHVYLTDFGLTKHALSIAGSTKPGHWVGTLDYVAPEQIRGERIDARADVYALGCMLFYMLTGEVPFKREGDEARLWAHLSEPPPKPSEHVEDLPDAFDSVIERALAKDPEERYPSAGDLGRAALAAAAGKRPSERERLVAKGSAAPVEAPTVTAAARPAAQPPKEPDTQLQPEAETVRQSPSKPRRSVLIAATVAILAAAGVIAVLLLGRDDDPGQRNATGPATTASATSTPTAAAATELKIDKELTIGRRPNVVRVADGNVFVGSFRSDRVRLVSTATRKPRAYAPRVGFGVNDAAITGHSIWLAVARDQQLVRLDTRTGRPVGDPIKMPYPVRAVTATKDAVWAGLALGDGQPDQLVKVDPKTGKMLATANYPYGIYSLTTSPNAVWVAARLRARIQRADLDTGEQVQEIQVGRSRTEDIVYRRGALWLATPDDDIVYKIPMASGDPIPISVGTSPRQLAVTDDTVYVTNYSSSDLTQIDVKSSRRVGDPFPLSASPFSLAIDGKALWVASLPENRLTRVLRGRGG
jgi:serine/threonine protein kinase/DNA-binding beta-propeller fold protein YncE